MNSDSAGGVLSEIREWRRYVALALAENRASGDILWQLQSSAKVLESIDTNLAEMVDHDEDEHDFDAAYSAQRLEAIIDSKEKTNALQIENIATNPRNLYTLSGQQPQTVRGAGKSLIAHLITEAENLGRDYVRVIALTQRHVERYRQQGFEVDQSKLSETEPPPTEEIPMVATVKDLKGRFGLS